MTELRALSLLYQPSALFASGGSWPSTCAPTRSSNALQAIIHGHIEPGAVFHSDRGAQHIGHTDNGALTDTLFNGLSRHGSD